MKTHDKESTGVGAVVADSVETMVRLPLQVTEATMDAVVQGVRWMTGSAQESNADTDSESDRYDGGASGVRVSSSKTSASSIFGSDTDLSGDDIKYVVWSIVFTKPGFEAVLQPHQDDLVSYSADTNTYAAGKIARFLERAREGQMVKPEGWAEHSYPAERREQPGHATPASQFAGTKPNSTESAWRIPPEDQKYIVFLYRVERRLPKPEADVVRVERVTVEQRV